MSEKANLLTLTKQVLHIGLLCIYVHNSYTQYLRLQRNYSYGYTKSEIPVPVRTLKLSILKENIYFQPKKNFTMFIDFWIIIIIIRINGCVTIQWLDVDTVAI